MQLLEAGHCYLPKQTLIDEYNQFQKEISSYKINDISEQHLLKNFQLKQLGETLQIDHKLFSPERIMCEFCSAVYDSKEDLEHDDKCFWCDCCDCYTYFENTRSTKDRFILILEDANAPTVKNHKDIESKLSAQLLPLRYPGGKSKLVQNLFSHI
ncbi:hypothetical protein LAV73_09355 [Lysinibacillus xylanilyticus]|uniref:hypothetical protein n=1 Tax=Lysinibacillus xylanilyticus TaxID=582475 RepID=UPI002B247096|nr:hypothetical protein [Lysinibacillus xylanilyticus]MEB2280200.1 hypothetical protein [Lysinibacillus xylanilyticus]